MPSKVTTTIETTTGLAFNPFQPDPAQIDVRDITTSLSRINRYLGHGRLPWSVLAHSVCVASMVPAEHRLTALLHDATEAYLGDVPAPLKSLDVFSVYRLAESYLWDAIAIRFGLPAEIPQVVLDADKAMRWHEARMLMKHPLAPCWLEYQPLARRFPPPAQSFRRLADPNHAQERWLAMFRLHYKGPHP
jgi:hypothetical protein